jgi:hypothetical protein
MDGSARTDNPGDLLDVMAKHFPGDTKDGPRSPWYDRSEAFDRGRAVVYWGGRGDTADTCRAEVTQSALDGLGFAGGLALARDLVEVGWRASARMDVYLDDDLGRITPARVDQAIMAGQAVTHCRPGRITLNRDDGSSTYYLGAPASDRRMRVYDKRGPTRAELQARRKASQAVLASLLGAEDPAQAVLANLVSLADFRESRRRLGHGNERAPRLDWWHELVGDTAKAEGAPSRPELSLSERADWVDRSLSAVLADLDANLGPAYLEKVLKHGRATLRARKLRVVA